MNKPDNRTVIIEKTFKAPRKLVWEAWTRPEHISNWWGPKGMKTSVNEHDFRVGGKWNYSMKMPNGGDFVSEGIYAEIVEGEKIVTSANFLPMTENVELHMLFEDEGEHTKFTFLVIHESEEYKLQQEKMGIYNGWGSTFDRLAEFLMNAS